MKIFSIKYLGLLFAVSASLNLNASSSEPRFTLELTDSITPPLVSRKAEFNGFGVSNISDNGKLVYLLDTAFNTKPGDPIGFLYRNVKGKLTLQSSFQVENDAFVNIETGCCNSQFTRFIYCADDGATAGLVRLFKLDNTGQFVKVGSDFSLPGFLAPSGAMNCDRFSFSPDGKLVAIIYVNDVSDPNNVTSRLIILDASGNQLTEVTHFDGLTGFSNGSNWFELCDGSSSSLFVTLGATSFASDAKFSFTDFHAPGNFYIFNFKNNTLKLNKVIEQPQFIEQAVGFNFECNDKTLIYVGTALSLNPNEETIYNDSAFHGGLAAQANFTPPNSNNRRIYEFDGKHLKLVYQKHIDGSSRGAAFFPSEKLIAIGQTAGQLRLLKPFRTANAQMINFFDIEGSDNSKKGKLSDKRNKVNLVVDQEAIPSSYSSQSLLFSANKRWFLNTGSQSAFSPKQPLGVNPVNLYRVRCNKK